MKYEEFDFPDCIVERLQHSGELVAWTQEPRKTKRPRTWRKTTCACTAPGSRRSESARALNQTECDKTILVIGGGAAGLSAALDAANNGYEVVLVEKEAELGGYGAKLHRADPFQLPLHHPEEPRSSRRSRRSRANPRSGS